MHANAAAPKYEAILRLDGWVESTSEEQAKGYPWAQEAELTAMTPGAPVVTAASQFLSGCTRTPVENAETDAILDEALNLVNSKGITRSLDGGKIRTIMEEKPESDVALEWLIHTEVS